MNATGTIIGIRDYGTLVIVSLGRRGGPHAPIPMDPRAFQHLLEGEGCCSTEHGRALRFLRRRPRDLPRLGQSDGLAGRSFPWANLRETPGALEAMDGERQTPDFSSHGTSSGDWARSMKKTSS